MSLLVGNCPLVFAFRYYSADVEAMSPNRVLLPARDQNRARDRVPVSASGSPSSPASAREGSSSAAFTPPQVTPRACTHLSVWGKYCSSQGWPLTEEKTDTKAINKHGWQTRTSALIVSLLMRAPLCCFPTVTFTAHINPCMPHLCTAHSTLKQHATTASYTVKQPIRLSIDRHKRRANESYYLQWNMYLLLFIEYTVPAV